jgi:hypothetical protein
MGGNHLRTLRNGSINRITKQTIYRINARHYNAPYFKLTFEETLHSLSIQTDKRFKVYIGDDASPEKFFGFIGKIQRFDFMYP